MSAALSEPIRPAHDREDDPTPATSRHLHAVGDQQLTVAHVPGTLATDIQIVGVLEQTVGHPAEEYAPAPGYAVPVPQSNVVYLRQDREKEAAHRRNMLHIESIKKMTQTIGAAFMEAELGLRPFMQLSSWLELELFHKLRTRVEHSVNATLAKQRSADTPKKVPSITPVAVRAQPRMNGDWETSMTIKVGDRARAIAMRIQLHRERWQVVALEIG